MDRLVFYIPTHCHSRNIGWILLCIPNCYTLFIYLFFLSVIGSELYIVLISKLASQEKTLLTSKLCHLYNNRSEAWCVVELRLDRRPIMRFFNFASTERERKPSNGRPEDKWIVDHIHALEESHMPNAL